MARPTTYKSSAVRVYLGDNADPIEYTAPCGLTTKAIRFNKGLNEVIVPDCDDPDAAAWREHDVESVSISVSGSGILAAEAVADYLAAWNSTDPVNAKIELVGSAATHEWTGQMHLANFEITAERGNRVQCSIEMESHGEMTHTPPA